MQFVHQPLTWAFLLVLLPLLIHLINMMRHRRVEWAAMEFLLASHKKHRRWVWLKQLLLLLLRMLAIAAAVAMFAKLVTQDRWAQFFGQPTTHHYVLLDDSLSMSDRTGNGSAYDRARQSVRKIISSARRGDLGQKLTLIRFSRAAYARDSNMQIADLNARLMNDELELVLEQHDHEFGASQLGVGPQPSLKMVEQLMIANQGERRVLHLISDFRSSDWTQPEQTRDLLSRLSQRGVEINLVRCADQEGTNLGITELRPDAGTQAAGVPLFVEAVIRNYATTPAERIKLQARSVFYPTSAQGTEGAGQTTELPDIVIDRIEPGQSVRRRFQVFFPVAGQHVVEADLPPDAVLGDNHQWAVISLQDGESVAIVDGDPGQRSAYYMQSIFRPGTKTKTGVVPVTQPLTYLRDATPEELARHHAIYLLDVPPLDQRTLDNLRQYIEQGGGLGCFLGPNYRESFYSAWYDSGVFPCPVGRSQPYESNDDSTAADVQFLNHPIFAALEGERNPFAASIRVREHVPPRDRWLPPADSGVAVLAKLRDGTPLVLERQFGGGRVVAFLSTLSPEWNNWALEPSFIVVALQLHAHLAQSRHVVDDRTVGDALRIQLDSTEYLPIVTFSLPATGNSGPRVIEKTATGNTSTTILSSSLGFVDPSGLAAAAANGETAPELTGETNVAGVYTVEKTTVSARKHRERFAYNVGHQESQLGVISRVALQQSLAPVAVRILEAEQPLDAIVQAPRNGWSQLLLLILALGLLIEQWLAYRLSYHAPAIESVGGSHA